VDPSNGDGRRDNFNPFDDTLLPSTARLAMLAERIKETVDYLVEMHRTFSKGGEYEDDEVDPDTFEDMLEAIADAANGIHPKRFRRVCLMRHLDRCAVANSPLLRAPLSWDIADIKTDDVAAILPAWGNVKAGAKAGGGKGKYTQLASLITARWGDTTKASSLETEHRQGWCKEAREIDREEGNP
jgi:hypothetical protein